MPGWRDRKSPGHFFGQLINPNKDRAAAHETSCPQQAVVRTKPESSRLACRQNLVTGLNDLTVDATTGECPGHFTLSFTTRANPC